MQSFLDRGTAAWRNTARRNHCDLILSSPLQFDDSRLPITSKITLKKKKDWHSHFYQSFMHSEKCHKTEFYIRKQLNGWSKDLENKSLKKKKSEVNEIEAVFYLQIRVHPTSPASNRAWPSIFTTFFKKKRFLYLFRCLAELQRDRISHLLVHFPKAPRTRARLRPKPGARNSLLVSQRA